MPFPHHIRSLAQVPAFAPLLGVCKKHDVEITAVGSLVRRLATHLLNLTNKGDAEEALPDLFALAPFLCDIKLRHSGKQAQTLAIRNSILSEIMHSECFSWHIWSAEEQNDYGADEVRLPMIPMTRLEMGTRAGTGMVDPFGASEDLITGYLRFYRNPDFYGSRPAKEKRDHELLHALEFLQVLCEQNSPLLPSAHPGWAVCCEIIQQSSGVQSAMTFAESAMLRECLVYRLKAIRAACGRATIWNALINESGLVPLLQHYSSELPRMVTSEFDAWISIPAAPPPQRPLAYIAQIGGHMPRVCDSQLLAYQGNGAQQDWETLIKTDAGINRVFNHPLPTLAEGLKVTTASPAISLYSDGMASVLDEEHVHMQFALEQNTAANCRQLGEENLGTLVAFRFNLEAPIPATSSVLRFPTSPTQSSGWHSCVLPLPAGCAFHSYQLLHGEEQTSLRVRVNCGRLLGELPELVGKAYLGRITGFELRVFIISDKD